MTSRDTGRWVLPKGWVKKGKSEAVSAIEEGWEEAGIRIKQRKPKNIGSYHYNKRLDDGDELEVDVGVYLARLDRLVDEFPEADERTRQWMTREQAAASVDEQSLTKLLRRLPE